MADLLVTGTLALDDVRTPFGEVADALGGSATFFAYAASFFTDVKLAAWTSPACRSRTGRPSAGQASMATI